MIKLDRMKYTALLILTFLMGSAVDLFAQSYAVKMMKIGKGSEQVFAADMYNGSLFYCSNAKAKKTKNIVNEDQSRFLNLYQIELNENLLLANGAKPVILPESVNSQLNEGPIFFNKTTGEAFFSSNVVSDSTALSLAIFSTQWNGQSGQYSLREDVQLALGDGNYSNPTLSDDGNLMVFSFTSLTDTSSDIYYSTKVGDKWLKPLPIETVNTPYNESFTRIYKNTLYFASDRPEGLGGLDIYKSTFNGINFEEPKTLPAPVNSDADDFLFIQLTTNKGFLSSNRVNGIDRIYSFEQHLPLATEFITSDINFCYTLQDETIQDKSRYDYVWDLGDGSKKNGAIIFHCYKDTGTFEVSCHLMDIKTLKIEEDIMNEKIEIYADFPLIRVSEYAGKKKIVLEQKWSRKNFTNFYWLVNGEVVTDEQIVLNSNHSKPYELKVVLWNNENPDHVFGITRIITPSE